MASSVLVSIAKLRSGRPDRMLPPDEALAYTFTPDEEIAIAAFRRVQIVGTQAIVRSRIDLAARSTLADEIMVASHTFDPAARLRSYELVASAWD